MSHFSISLLLHFSTFPILSMSLIFLYVPPFLDFPIFAISHFPMSAFSLFLRLSNFHISPFPHLSLILPICPSSLFPLCHRVSQFPNFLYCPHVLEFPRSQFPHFLFLHFLYFRHFLYFPHFPNVLYFPHSR